MLLHLTLPLIRTSILLNENQCLLPIQRAYQLQILVIRITTSVRYQSD